MTISYPICEPEAGISKLSPSDWPTGRTAESSLKVYPLGPAELHLCVAVVRYHKGMIGPCVKDRSHGPGHTSEHRLCCLYVALTTRLYEPRSCVCVHKCARSVPNRASLCTTPKVVLAPLLHSYPVHTSGGGLHSLATAALHTECPIECSIECSIGLLPIFRTVAPCHLGIDHCDPSMH